MTAPSQKLIWLAEQCGINGHTKTVEQIKAEHDTNRHPEFADQFDMRLEEQIAKELRKTSCWNCHEQYSFYEENCPDCGATNGNHDFELAQIEAVAKFGTAN